jgi:hypothetical protein
MWDEIKNSLPRMSVWITITIVLLVALYVIKPAAIIGTFYKVLLFTGCLIATYWGDRALFARLSDRLDSTMPRDIFSAARVISRALMFLGAAQIFGLGV